MIKEEVEAKKWVMKFQTKMLKNKKKSLTVCAPFELRTSKRIKIDEDFMSQENSQPYEPLWLQV